MLDELLKVPSRRFSNMPELVGFFQLNAGDGWEALLERFLKTFTGTSITVPGPAYLAELREDEKIVRRLQADQCAAETRIMLLEKYRPRLTYQHMQEIYVCGEGRLMQPPLVPGGRHSTLARATELAAAHPKIAGEIFQMFQITAHERAALARRIEPKPASKPASKPATKAVPKKAIKAKATTKATAKVKAKAKKR